MKVNYRNQWYNTQVAYLMPHVSVRWCLNIISSMNDLDSKNIRYQNGKETIHAVWDEEGDILYTEEIRGDAVVNRVAFLNISSITK